MAAGAALRRHLATWRSTLAPAPALPFVTPARDRRVAAAASVRVAVPAQGAASTRE
jgi:hypothetical protein